MREPICSCASCLTVQRGGAVLLPGGAVARAREQLQRAAEQSRLAAEVMRIARDPETWMVSRIPEIYPSAGFRVGAFVRLVDDVRVAFEFGLRMRATGEPDAMRRFAIVQRSFRSMSVGESIDFVSPWVLSGVGLPVGAAMKVISLEPPALVLEPQRAWSENAPSGFIDTFRIYADALVPFDIQ